MIDGVLIKDIMLNESDDRKNVIDMPTANPMLGVDFIDRFIAQEIRFLVRRFPTETLQGVAQLLTHSIPKFSAFLAVERQLGVIFTGPTGRGQKAATLSASLSISLCQTVVCSLMRIPAIRAITEKFGAQHALKRIALTWV